MTMSYLFTALVLIAVVCSAASGQGAALAAATVTGAGQGITLGISIAGSLCLWSGFGALAEAGGFTKWLATLFRPLLTKLFPEAAEDQILQGALSSNFCANLLGLGNAATPMGIQAAKRLVSPKTPETATDSLCRLIVLNTASIQLIPSNVAAIRASLGCGTPFDILPAVWCSSLCSAGLGLLCAWGLGKLYG